MKFYSFLVLCLFAITTHAQIPDKTGLNIAYQYTGRNIIQDGSEFKTNTAREQSLIAGTSMLYTSINHKDKFLPEANILTDPK
ncbi:hypothetical protein DRF60_17695 [Chryseobacterium elymi]|uniref:Uncharacterized protein n=1 Tax=Chryseobacterium elymi TaxID=395936 RepID=A0A3D9D8Z6_9FLAO|nr:hypothetical protein [Chryseobacterium elymi]REC74482.1 hypothetical protein DRF60_17695 [Chryseobacterium elymi]